MTKNFPLCDTENLPIDDDEFFPVEQSIMTRHDDPLSGDSYLEYVDMDEGGYRARDIVNACATSSALLDGRVSGLTYFKRLYCMRIFCRKCNAHGGRLHSRRKDAIYRRLPEGLQNMFIRQWVFTLPKDLVPEFRCKSRLNALHRGVSKILKAFYPKHGWILYFHATGKTSEFFPHVNAHVIERTVDSEGRKIEGLFWKETAERIQAIQKRWKMVIAGILNRSLADYEMKPHYEFRKDQKSMRHALEYMSRPLTVEKKFAKNYSDELIDFFAEDLKGFQFLRFGGVMRNATYKENLLDIKELEDVVGEPLKFREIISDAELDLKIKSGDVIEIAPGLFRETELAYARRKALERNKKFKGVSYAY